MTLPKVIDMFDQGEMWVTKGEHLVKISDMTPVHRHRAAAHLARNAVSYRCVYARAQGIGDPRGFNAQKWITHTAVYLALVNGLSPDVRRRARHWMGCPVRTQEAGPHRCTCHRSNCPSINGGVCNCRKRRDTTAEEQP
jgi:hypothetical protein